MFYEIQTPLHQSCECPQGESSSLCLLMNQQSSQNEVMSMQQGACFHALRKTQPKSLPSYTLKFCCAVNPHLLDYNPDGSVQSLRSVCVLSVRSAIYSFIMVRSIKVSLL